MLKKLLVLASIVGGAAYIAKKAKTAKDERALWHEATTAPDLLAQFQDAILPIALGVEPREGRGCSCICQYGLQQVPCTAGHGRSLAGI